MRNFIVMQPEKKVKRRNIFIFTSLVIIILFETNYVLDLNEELSESISKLTELKAEDHSLIENSELINSSENGDIDVNKPKEKEDRVRVIKVVKDSKVVDEVEFLDLRPKIDFKTLKSRYEVVKPKVYKKMSVVDKKRNFIQLMLPIIQESRKELIQLSLKIQGYKGRELSIHEETYLNKLFDLYNISNREIDSLLTAIQPHPVSLVLAQAAMESGWGTSRFFHTGNNIFGVWSFDSKDERIEAKSREGVYLKKYDSLKESVDDYFLILGRVAHYKEFRDLRRETKDPKKLAEQLSSYSESSDYVKNLKIIMRVNKFTQYDSNK